jgi:hypothetical protein
MEQINEDLKRFTFIREKRCKLQTFFVTQVVTVIRLRIKLEVLFCVMVLQVYGGKGDHRELNLEFQVCDIMFCVSFKF